MRRVTASLMVPRRALFALLLVCALVARLAAPAGWMPSREGGAGLMLCPGFAPEPRAEIGHHGGGRLPADRTGHDGDAVGQPCAFAAASLAMDRPSPSLGEALPPPPVETGAPALPAAAAPGRGLAAPPPFATGPPLRA